MRESDREIKRDRNVLFVEIIVIAIIYEIYKCSTMLVKQLCLKERMKGEGD